jgi:hypothetical protein
MKLTVAEGQRHDGTAASGARFDGVVDDDVIELDDPYTVVEWLEIANFSGTAVEGISIGVTGPNSLAQNLLIHDFTGAKHAVVVYPVATLRNTIIYNGPEGIRITNGSADATLENLTIWNVTQDCVDLDSGNSLDLRNCILLGAGDVDLEIDGTVNYLGYTMYSTWSGQDPEGFDGNNQSPPADLDDLFVSITAGLEDLHVENYGHAALDNGVDIAGFSNDIDGELRASGTWDLGADEMSGTINYRSIGTQVATLYSTGDATVTAGQRVVTFGGGASLPTNIGQGDELVIGAETFYILSRDSSTQVTTQSAAAIAHSADTYTISRAYNDFQSWEDARGGNLAGEARREVGVAYNDGTFTPGSGILIGGSTTSSAHYMMITVAESQRHSGVAGTGVVIDSSGHGSRTIEVQDEYTVIEWLEIKSWSSDAVKLSDSPSANGSLVQNLILHDFVSATRAVNMQTDATFRNSVVYNGRSGIRVQDGSNGIVENVTFYDMTQEGIDGSSTAASIIVRNTIAVACVTYGMDIDCTVNYFDHNMYSSLLGPTPGANDKSPPADLDDLFYTIAAGSEDLHLEDSGHDAVDTGLDLSTTGGFTTDIDEDTRSSPWDMGADEVATLPLRISSGANQTFTVGDPTTAISAITVTDHGETPVITAANDIRIRIPAAFNMDWDVFDTIATIGGSAAAKVSDTVSYEDSDKTLVIDVTSDFAASDAITISDLSYTDFTATSSTDYLDLDVYDNATADATDDKNIEVEAAPAAPGSTSTPLVSWREVEPEDVPAPSSSTSISFDDVTPNVSTDDRNSASFAHTVGSCSCCSDSIIVVVTVTRGDQEATDVSYGGQALVPAVSERASTDSGNEWVKIWYRTNPLPGTNMVDVTFDITEAPTCVTALSYFGVHQGSPLGAVASDSDISSSNPVTVNISTTVDGSVVVGGLGQHGGDTDPHDQGTDITTEHWDAVSGSASSSDSGYAGGEIATTTTGIYTFEWTGNVSDDWAIACIELKPAE